MDSRVLPRPRWARETPTSPVGGKSAGGLTMPLDDDFVPPVRAGARGPRQNVNPDDDPPGTSGATGSTPTKREPSVDEGASGSGPKMKGRLPRDEYAQVLDEGDAGDEAIQVVYGDPVAAAKQREEVAELRAQVEHLKNDRKRAWEADEEADRGRRPKRARTETVLGPAISREDIEAATQMLTREAALQARIHANPYVEFAMAVSESYNGGKNPYEFVNNVYSNMLARVFRGAAAECEATSKAIANAVEGLRLMGVAARAFPGQVGELEGSMPQEAFARVYKSLEDAVRIKNEREVVLATMAVLEKPDLHNVSAISPGLVSTARRVLMNAELKAGFSKGTFSLEQLIEDDLGRSLLASVVGEDKLDKRTSMPYVPKSRMQSGKTVRSRAVAHLELEEYLRRKQGMGLGSYDGFGGIGFGGLGVEGVGSVGSGRTTLGGLQVPQQLRYTASGIPVRTGF